MVEEMKSVKDWTYIPIIVMASAGFIVSVLDFFFLQHSRFQVVALAGIFLYTIGAYVRFKSRLQLKEKAKFDSLAATGKLQINKGHRLVKDGLYKHIRHPIYLGETLRNLGLAIVFTSVLGLFFMAVATILLLFRIEIEERMLVETFGEDYRDYRKNTKRIIPYIY